MTTMNEVREIFQRTIQFRNEPKTDLDHHGLLLGRGRIVYVDLISHAPTEYSAIMAINAAMLWSDCQREEAAALVVFEVWVPETSAAVARKERGHSVAGHPGAFEALCGAAQVGDERVLWIHRILSDGTVGPNFLVDEHQFEFLRLPPDLPPAEQEDIRRARTTLRRGREDNVH